MLHADDEEYESSDEEGDSDYFTHFLKASYKSDVGGVRAGDVVAVHPYLVYAPPTCGTYLSLCYVRDQVRLRKPTNAHQVGLWNTQWIGLAPGDVANTPSTPLVSDEK